MEAALDAAERDLFTAVKKAVEASEARTLKRLRSVKARRGTRHWDWGDDYDPAREKKDLDPMKVFDVEAEKDAFSRSVLPTVANIYETFGEGTAESLGVAFNLRDPNVARDVLERDNRLRGTVDTTWEKVQEAIIDGEAEGEGIDGIARRIEGVFSQAKGYRARMIARTETVGASNAASLQAADASGVVGKKTWLAASDPRTRASHVSADGQTVDVKKAFNVGGSKMMHPGDPNGGASQTVNCRCSMVFARLPDEEIPTDLEPEDLDLDARASRVEDAVRQGREQGLETHRLHHARPEAPDGFYTRARHLEQEDLLDELWEAADNIPNEGDAVFSGGLGGAGKGTVLRSADAGVDTSRYFTIDPDAIKEAMARRGMIPTIEGFEDLSPMELSALIHEESSHLAARLATRALAERKNVIFDITMSSRTSVVKRLNLLKEAGYDQIEMIFVDIPVETSVKRALARWERGLREYLDGDGVGGRYVPPDIIRKQADEVWGSVNRGVFEDLKDQVDGWRLFDNAGDSPVLVAEKILDLPKVRLTRTGVDIAEEMPTGLSKDEAAAWFQRKWGRAIRRDVDPETRLGYWTEVDRQIGFSTLSKTTHEDLLRFLDEMFSKAPAVADRIPYLGTFTWLKATREALSGGRLGLRLLNRVGKGVQGMARRRTFLGTGSKSFRELVETARAQKSVGWWTTGEGRHILAHEFGHHVHYTVEEALDVFNGDQGVLTREILDPAFREARLEMGTAQGLTRTSGIFDDRAWLQENLSKYGSQNAYEVCAEAWAEYVLMGDKARPLAIAIGSRLEAALATLPT